MMDIRRSMIIYQFTLVKKSREDKYEEAKMDGMRCGTVHGAGMQWM